MTVDPNDSSLHRARPPGRPDASAYQLDCADPTAREGLHSWLDGSRLVWPGRFKLTVTVSETPPVYEDQREVLWQPTVAIQTGPSSGTVRLRWDPYPAVAVIHPTLPEANLWLSPAAVAHLDQGHRSFLLIVMVFVLRRLGWYHVHGAALVDPRGRGWLMAGDSGSGKSTTTALLASHGWEVSTDDIGFLVHQGSRAAILGFHSLIALRSGGQQMLGAAGGVPLAHRDKSGFLPEELGGRWVAEVVPLVIAFPRLGQRTAVAAMAPAEVLVNLVKWSQWVMYEPVHAQDHLDALGRMAAQARCFNLTLGPDLFEHPDRLLELTQ